MELLSKNIALIDKPEASWVNYGEDYADHAISNEIRGRALAVVLPVIRFLRGQTAGVAVGSTQGFAFAAENDFSSMTIVDNFLPVARMALLYKYFLATFGTPRQVTDLLLAFGKEEYFRKQAEAFYYTVRERIKDHYEINLLYSTDDDVDLALECKYLLNNIRFNYLLENSYLRRADALQKLQGLIVADKFKIYYSDIFDYVPAASASFIYFSNLFEWAVHEKKEVGRLPWVNKHTISLYSVSRDGDSFCDYFGGTSERWGYRFSPTVSDGVELRP